MKLKKCMLILAILLLFSGCSNVSSTSTQKSTALQNVIEDLPGINWSEYAKKNQQGFFEIMNSISEIKTDNEDWLLNILHATNGLDGAYAEAYSNAVKNLFFNNRDNFKKVLTKLDDSQFKKISSYIQYACSEDEWNEVKTYLIKD